MVKNKHLGQYCADHTAKDRVRIARAAGFATVTAAKVAARGPCARCFLPVPADRPPYAKYCGEECLRLHRLDARRTSEAYRESRKRTLWRRRSKGLPVGFPSRVLSREIHDRCGWRCYLCAVPVVAWDGEWRPDLATIDHVVPLARGGHPTDPANLRTACAGCNSEKRDKILATA